MKRDGCGYGYIISIIGMKCTSMIIKGLCYSDGNEESILGSNYSERIILRSFLSQENYNILAKCAVGGLVWPCFYFFVGSKNWPTHFEISSRAQFQFQQNL